MPVITQFGQIDCTGISTGSPQTKAVSNFAAGTVRAMLWWNSFGSATGVLNGPDYQSTFGFAVGPTSNQSYVAVASNSGVDTAAVRTRNAFNSPARRESTSSTVENLAYLGYGLSGAGTFDWQLNVASATAPSTTINFLAIGDDDGSVQAATFSHQPPSGAGPDPVTGFGFQPDVVLSLWSSNSTTGNFSAVAPGLGIWTPDLTHHVSVTAQANVGTSNTTNWAQSTTLTCNFPFGIQQQGTITGFTADGFDFNWTTSNARSFQLLGLAGVNPVLGSFQTPTTPTTVAVPLTITPKGAVFINTGELLDTGPSPHLKLDYGASDGTSQASVSIYDEDNLDVTNCGRTTSSSHVIQARDNTMAIADSASVALGASSLDLTFDVADATARDIIYLAIGDPGGVAPEPLSATLTGSIVTAGAGDITAPTESLSATLTGSIDTAGDGAITAPTEPLSATLTGSIATAGSGSVTPPSEPLSATLTGSITTAGNAEIVAPGVEPLSATLTGSIATAGAGTVTPQLSATLTGSIATAGNATLISPEPLSATLTGSIATVGNGSIAGVESLSATLTGSIATVGNGSIAGVEALSATLTGSIATGGAASITPLLSAVMTGSIRTAGNAQVGEYAPVPCRTSTVAGNDRTATVRESRIASPDDCH